MNQIHFIFTYFAYFYFIFILFTLFYFISFHFLLFPYFFLNYHSVPSLIFPQGYSCNPRPIRRQFTLSSHLFPTVINQPTVSLQFQRSPLQKLTHRQFSPFSTNFCRSNAIFPNSHTFHSKSAPPTFPPSRNRQNSNFKANSTSLNRQTPSFKMTPKSTQSARSILTYMPQNKATPAANKLHTFCQLSAPFRAISCSLSDCQRAIQPTHIFPLLLASQHRQQSTIVDSKPTPLSTITYLVTTTTQFPTTLTTLQHAYTQITLTLITASEHPKFPFSTIPALQCHSPLSLQSSRRMSLQISLL